MDRSEKLRKYIEENPGSTEYQIARFVVKHKFCARGTAHNVLYNTLIPEGKIVDRKEGNSFHRFYINDQNDFNVVMAHIHEQWRALETLEALVRKNIKKIERDSRLRNLAHLAHLDFYIMTGHIAQEINRRIKSMQNREILYLSLAEILKMTSRLSEILVTSRIITAQSLVRIRFARAKGLKKTPSSDPFVALASFVNEH
jgi:hypothetical protein